MEYVNEAWWNINNVPKNLFLVLGGNEHVGKCYTKKELIKNWKYIYGRLTQNNDVYIYLDGKLFISIQLLGRTLTKTKHY